MNIVVLAGGNSTERSISIVSGSKVTEALRSRGHNAVLVDVCFGAKINDPANAFATEVPVEEAVEWMHAQDERVPEVDKRKCFFGEGVLALCEAADVVFMALHGANGENGKIQAAFELLGIKFTGSTYLGSALGMSKELSKTMFREYGVPTPAGFVLRKGDEVLSTDKNGVGLPCVVKVACGGSSVGVEIPKTEEEYQKAIANAFALEDVLIVEQFVDGREFSVGVVDGEAYPVIEIAPIEGFYDYTNKYKAGSTVETCPAQISEEQTKEMQKHAVDAYNALRLTNYGRIDVMMDKDGKMYCLEANTLPGMTPTSLLPQEAAAIGMDFADLCEKLINVSVQAGA